MADLALVAGPTVDAELVYTIPGAQEIVLKQVRASFDGTLAAGSWQPLLSVIAPNGAILGEYVSDTTLAAGASADVTWFPRGAVSKTSSGGGATEARVPLDTPGASIYNFLAFTGNEGYVNVRRLLPALASGGAGTWEGAVRVPNNYSRTPAIVLQGTANATSGNVRLRVSSSVVADGQNEDAAYTDEAYVDTATPATANDLLAVSFALSTAPVAGALLNVKVTRDGGNPLDTLGADWVIVAATFTYS